MIFYHTSSGSRTGIWVLVIENVLNNYPSLCYQALCLPLIYKFLSLTTALSGKPCYSFLFIGE